MGWMKNMIIKWLGIQPAVERKITIRESMNHSNYILMNRIWYRSDPAELNQFYKQIGSYYGNDSRFWSVVPRQGKTVRKIHTGLPALIIDTLNDITNDDSLEIELDETHTEKETDLWREIAEDNNFMALQKDATEGALHDGDGAFKASIDRDISDYPIIEFFSGDEVEYKYTRGRLIEIYFITFYTVDKKTYKLVETYGRGYIKCELLDEKDTNVELTSISQTSEFDEMYEFDGDFIMAVPLKFLKSSKYENRGKSLIDGKYDSFDSLDEVVSQWLDAIRLGRVNKFIPDSMIPRDTEGNKLPINPITNTFYTYETPAVQQEDGNGPKPEHVQPSIDADSMLKSYIQFLDMCLMGLISPSTLGIDVKKLDNGEAQREKEKATMYTRDKLIGVLQKVIPRVVDVAMKVQDLMNNKTPKDYAATIAFGEYANPSFEAQIDTLGKAKSYEIMSTEEVVEELYGDTKDDEWKALEVKRIKEDSKVAQDNGEFGGMDNFFREDPEDDDEPGNEE